MSAVEDRDEYLAENARPLAFAAGVLDTPGKVTDMWSFLCKARLCIHDDDYDVDCVDRLACLGITPAAAVRSPVSGSIRSAAELLDWCIADLRNLIRAL